MMLVTKVMGVHSKQEQHTAQGNLKKKELKKKLKTDLLKDSLQFQKCLKSVLLKNQQGEWKN